MQSNSNLCNRVINAFLGARCVGWPSKSQKPSVTIHIVCLKIIFHRVTYNVCLKKCNESLSCPPLSCENEILYHCGERTGPTSLSDTKRIFRKR